MDFTGYQYSSDIIIQAVRYYVSYKLNTRGIKEIFSERSSAIDQLTDGLSLLLQCLSTKIFN